MINDRGTIKWPSSMLPEHVEMLKQLREEESYKQKPLIDEQLMEENEIKLQLAIHNNSSVRIKYFHNHDFHTVKGKLRSVNQDGTIIINDEERTKIKFNDVIEVYEN